jgi:hypothetical protein
MIYEAKYKQVCQTDAHKENDVQHLDLEIHAGNVQKNAVQFSDYEALETELQPESKSPSTPTQGRVEIRRQTW